MPARPLPFLFIILLGLCSSCIISSDSPVETSSDDVNLIQRGDIVIVNTGNDTILLLDENGVYKDTLVDSNTDNAILFNGLFYDSTLRKVLYLYDHGTASFDSVRSIDLFDGAESRYLSNNQLTGVLPGLTRLSTGELLVLETGTTAEKFSSGLTRVGAPFTAALVTSVTDVSANASGGFAVASSSTATPIRVYSAAAATVASATSTAPVPTLGVAMGATSVIHLSNGNVCVAYSGTADAVRCYTSNLATTVWTFSDQNVLQTPGKLALRSNGNLLVTDTFFDHIVEISPTGGLVRVIAGNVLSDPVSIVVIP